MGNSVNNSKFRLSSAMFSKPLKTEELMQLVEQENTYILRKFRIQGYITGNEYDFVNMANFDFEQNSVVNSKDYREVIKTDEEKLIAKENILAIEKYFRIHIPNRKIEIKFLHGERNEHQCVLVNTQKKFSAEAENEIYEFLYS